MAQSSGGGEIIKYGLLAVGGYLLYNWWVSQPAAAPVTAIPLPPGVPSVPVQSTSPAPPVPTPPTGSSGGGAASLASSTALADALDKAAGLNAAGTLNADQWSYYYSQLGHTPIPSTTFDSLFFPNGRPADPTQYPQLLAAQFVVALASKGLNGFGQCLPGDPSSDCNPMGPTPRLLPLPGGPQAVPGGFAPPIIWGRLPGGGFAGMGGPLRRIDIPVLLRRAGLR